MLLSIQNISKSFGSEKILHNISLAINANKTYSILGKSGCGKTTLLKIIAGILPQQSGDILLNNVNINLKKPNERNIIYMSQEPLLFPHLNVFNNIAFGLQIRKIDNKIITQKVNELLLQLGLETQANKMPHQLSGGQKQRVNFGRAIVVNPPLLLLDEPFGNLDVQTRASMQQLFKTIATTFNITSIFVTHDVKEAILMADEIGYMRDGNLTMYTSTKAFIDDEETGAKAEINFWKTL